MSNPSPDISPAPKPLRLISLLIGLAVGVSALPGLWLTLVAGESVLWFSTLFELLVIGAAVICVLAGLGRFRSAWGLALACAAGTVLVTAVFAFVEVRANFGEHPSIAKFLKPAAAFRVGSAGLIALAASLAVWSRDRRSVASVVRAVIVLLPVAAVAGWIAFGSSGALLTARESPGAEGIRLVLLVVGSLVGIGLVSAAGHLLIRAYEFGRPPAKAAEASE